MSSLRTLTHSYLLLLVLTGLFFGVMGLVFPGPPALSWFLLGISAFYLCITAFMAWSWYDDLQALKRISENHKQTLKRISESRDRAG